LFQGTLQPTIAALPGLADETGKVAALDRDVAELGRRFDLGGGAMEWECLLFTVRRAD
jgi:hypothetical protein